MDIDLDLNTDTEIVLNTENFNVMEYIEEVDLVLSDERIRPDPDPDNPEREKEVLKGKAIFAVSLLLVTVAGIGYVMYTERRE